MREAVPGDPREVHSGYNTLCVCAGAVRAIERQAGDQPGPGCEGSCLCQRPAGTLKERQSTIQMQWTRV